MKIFFFLFFFFCNLFAQNTDSKNAQNALEQSKEVATNFPFTMAKSPLENISIFQYSGVLLILFGLVLVLFFIKKYLNKTNGSVKLNEIFKKKEAFDEVKILSQTNLNLTTKLIIFEAYEHRYLVIIGQNGIEVVDKYPLIEFGDCLKNSKDSL